MEHAITIRVRRSNVKKTHKTGLKIVGAGYLPHEHNAKGFPNWILVRAKDGEEAKYRR